MRPSLASAIRWRVALVAAVQLGGCLYVDGINHAPEVSVALEPGELTLGATVTLSARASDQDGDRIGYAWRVRGTDLERSSFVLTDTSGTRGDDGPAPVIGVGERLRLVLQTRGSYEVELAASDPLGATRTARTTFELRNLAPEVVLALTALDAAPGYEQRHPAHATYVVNAAGSLDDDDLRCGEGASVAWELLTPGSDRLERFETIPCGGQQLLDKLELRLRPGAVSAPTDVEVRATVSDAHGGAGSASLRFTLSPNRQPCIPASAFEPSGARRVVLVYSPDGGVGASVGVAPSTVDDDVRYQARFSWSIAEEQGGPYRALPDATGSIYPVPRDLAPPGARRYLRLRVDDAEALEPQCAESIAECRDDDLPADCHRWLTWTVEVR